MTASYSINYSGFNAFYSKAFICFIFCFIFHNSQAQMTAGTTGFLNTPSAYMQKDGTFMLGANVLPQNMTPEEWDYTTANYYVNITFLPFLELAYRCTFFEMENGDIQQDRSFSARIQILKEKKNRPAFLIGSDDIISEGFQTVASKEEDSNQFFGTLYTAISKTISHNQHFVNINIGYGFSSRQTKKLKGIFAALEYHHKKLNNLSTIIEYDTKRLNAGLRLKLIKHFRIDIYTSNFKQVGGGFNFSLKL